MKPTHSQITNALQEYLICNVLATGVEFTADTNFVDIGIDSVTVIELVIHVDDKFGIDIPVDQLTSENLMTVNTITECAMVFMRGKNTES